MADSPYNQPSNPLMAQMQWGQNQQAQQNPWQQDFTPQLGQILAPYQQLAQKISSPYATMPSNSWLGQNHPQAAGILDNAMLTMGMTPQAEHPEGAGGGIARTMQGLIGAQQYNRQRTIQQAMLPYQLAMGELQARDLASQIPMRYSEAARNRAWMENITNATDIKQQLADTRQQLADQQKEVAAERTSPSALMSRQAALMSGIDPDKVDQASAPQIQNYLQNLDALEAKSRQRQGIAGGLEGQMLLAANPMMPGETEQDWAKRILPQYINMRGQIAGAGAAGTTGVTAPIKNTQDFTDSETKNVLGTVPKPMTLEEYTKTQDPLGIKQMNPAFTLQMQKDYNNNVMNPYNQQMAKTRTNLAHWRTSGAPANGIGYDEWLANPSGQTVQPTQGGATPATSPGLNWNPK